MCPPLAGRGRRSWWASAGGSIGRLLMSELTGIMPIGEMIFVCLRYPESFCSLVGGDHLDPGSWQNEPAEIVMKKARELLRD